MIPGLCTLVRTRCGVSTISKAKCFITNTYLSDAKLWHISATRNHCMQSDRLSVKSNVASPPTHEGEGYDECNAKIPRDADKLSLNANTQEQECNKSPVKNTVPSVEKRITDAEKGFENIDIKIPKALDICTEDVSDIGPKLLPPRTFAYLADKSETIQQLVKLGVELHKLEKDPELVKKISYLDFSQVKPYIQFLHDWKVPADNIGKVITKCPKILFTDMDDMATRIKYLVVHDFSSQMISTIITKKPEYLLLSVKTVDERFGYLQKMFKLTGNELRNLVTNHTRFIDCRTRHIDRSTLCVMEDMGFNAEQMKILLLNRPSIWTKNQEGVVNTFVYAHEEMKLDHDTLLKHSPIFLCKRPRLEKRHKFLVELKKAQFNPKEPGYISPTDVVLGDDLQFCTNVAKCDISLYNAYLKTF